LSEFTHILERVEHGDPNAAAELLPVVYEELRRLAAQKMANEAAGHTLQPTALVHEAWMRLGGSDAPTFQNRAHFFGAAAEAMRRILIEHARRRLAAKRGASVEVVELDGLEISSPLNVNTFCPSIAHVRLDEPITHAIYPGSGGRAVRAGP